ncbi:MAG: hypothetical protein JXA46_10300 [Dehalococcoidales bacterium]|nr:hypothetical protein [Dehalococcoidales bacterium]
MANTPDDAVTDCYPGLASMEVEARVLSVLRGEECRRYQEAIYPLARN